MIDDTELARIRRHATDYTGIPSQDALSVLDALDAARADNERLRADAGSHDRARCDRQHAVGRAQIEEAYLLGRDLTRENAVAPSNALAVLFAQADSNDRLRAENERLRLALKAQTEALLRLAAGWERECSGPEGVQQRRCAAELNALLSGGAVPARCVRPAGLACKVCEAVPDTYGERVHGRGCYQIDEHGGGVETVGAVPEAAPVVWREKGGVKEAQIGNRLLMVYKNDIHNWFWRVERLAPPPKRSVKGTCPTEADAKAAAVAAARSAK